MVATATYKPTHRGSRSKVFYKKSRTRKFRKIHRKIPAPDNFLEEAGIERDHWPEMD